MPQPPTIAITIGDPGGVGPEVIFKTLRKHSLSPRFRYILFGIPGVFDSFTKKQNSYFTFPPFARFEDVPLKSRGIYLVDISRQARRLQFEKGKVSRINAAVAYAALKEAVKYALQGKVSALVTAPVNKTSMRLVDPNFQGHTEYLAKQSGVKEFAMMFVSRRLKVTLATIHVPLKSVSRLITSSLVYQKIRLTDEFLKRYFRIRRPKIAVCALNPHGKETGKEDEQKIRPAVRRAQAKGVRATGPLSADQLFFDAYERRFDAVVSMYHDQGLAPFKMIAFKEGVNVTLGLPFIRTSPDHGTAFDIAYQDKADPTSMKSALALAEQLLRHYPFRYTQK